jgi:outer membrane lipoprotein-sorting protein
MKMHNSCQKLSLSLVLLLLVLLPVMAQMTGSSIMHEVMLAQRSNSSALDINLTLIDENGLERERRLQTLTFEEDGKTKILTVFLSPSSVKNTRFLTIETETGSSDQWIYLPSLAKVKRIAAQEEGGSFMGSDFTYADMGSTTYDDKEAAHTLLKEEALGKRMCYVVDSKPTIASDYGKTVTWVDKETYLPVQVEFYEKDALTVKKRLLAEDLSQIGDKWLSRILTMTTLATNHSTRIEILQAKFDIPLDERFFTLPFLETGRLL